VLLLLALCLVVMPFSVFGVKGRLEALEVQLDEIQAEIRSLALRMGEPAAPRRGPAATDEWVEPPASYVATPARDYAAPRVAPPVPPPAAWPEAPARGAVPSRAEPRLDWPRNRN
jgi:hypothetical protein